MSDVRVVIVDDDALVRAALRMILRDDAGIELVGEADDGDTGLDAGRPARRPTSCCMDIRMPRLDGLEALARLMSRTTPPKVIVLTTFDADDHVVRALRGGASGFLLKHTPPARSSTPCTRSPTATTCSPPA